MLEIQNKIMKEIRIDKHTTICVDDNFELEKYKERCGQRLPRPLTSGTKKIDKQKYIDDCKHNYNRVCHRLAKHKPCDCDCPRMKQYEKRNGGKK